MGAGRRIRRHAPGNQQESPATSRDEERPTPAPGIILLTLGKVSEQIVGRIKTELASALAKKVRGRGGGPLPVAAFDRRRGQYDSTGILEFLAAERQRIGGGHLLAVADVDLFAGGLNFVFGETAPAAGVGVVSLWRLNPERWGGPRDQGLFEARAAREAIHEAGHLFGLRHCPDRRCVMSFSNSLAEVDAKSSDFCPACRRFLASC
jgi:archaemetzincin